MFNPDEHPLNYCDQAAAIASACKSDSEIVAAVEASVAAYRRELELDLGSRLKQDVAQ